MRQTINNELKLSISGIGILIKWEDSRIFSWPHIHFTEFVSEDDPEIFLNIHCTDLPQHSSSLVFDGKNDGNWRLFQNDSGYIIETFNTLTGEKNSVCYFRSDFRKGEVFVIPQQGFVHRLRKIFDRRPSWSFPYLMQPLVQLLLINVLTEKEGFMAHGLAINDRGKGRAFLGGSGTGKSTMAKLWEGRERVAILSDEHIVIKKNKGQYWLYGTPWPGMAETLSSEKVPLHQLFIIEHASENRVLEQGGIGDFFPQLFLPFWDRTRIDSVLRQCEDVFKTLGLKKLGFIKDESVVEFVRSL